VKETLETDSYLHYEYFVEINCLKHMPLYLTDKYVWDFWTIKQADLYHIFYLQAARTPYNPELRHDCASVGHAVSYDLVHWEFMPDALQPGQPGSWDDRAIWTGCVEERDNLHYMFYTSSSHTDEGKVQHIGLVTSEDLINWERHPDNPLIDASPVWYEKIGDPGVSQEAWRDPYIVYDQESEYYYAYICARVNYGPSDGRGAIGLARSRDLIKWDVMPPVYASGEFTYMEVPQVVPFDGRYHLIFCVGSEWHSAARRARLSDPAAYLCGTYALISDQITGDYILTNERGLLADLDGTYYAGKIVFNPIGEPTILATRQYNNSNQYYGALIDPMKVGYNSQGYLRLINHL
jgi:beta-fructofuranosidase